MGSLKVAVPGRDSVFLLVCPLEDQWPRGHGFPQFYHWPCQTNVLIAKVQNFLLHPNLKWPFCFVFLPAGFSPPPPHSHPRTHDTRNQQTQRSWVSGGRHDSEKETGNCKREMKDSVGRISKQHIGWVPFRAERYGEGATVTVLISGHSAARWGRTLCGCCSLSYMVLLLSLLLPLR